MLPVLLEAISTLVALEAAIIKRCIVLRLHRLRRFMSDLREEQQCVLMPIAFDNARSDFRFEAGCSQNLSQRMQQVIMNVKRLKCTGCDALRGDSAENRNSLRHV